MSYPFWKDQETSIARSSADRYKREADKSKQQLDAINDELSKYKSLGYENTSKEELVKILNTISEILK